MAHVTVTIAGKGYRMACGDGEEAHLEELAALFDQKIATMRDAFGEIGDMRLHVMAALTVADDLLEARSRVSALEAEMAEMKSLVSSTEESSRASEERIADAVLRAADHVERLAKSLNIATSAAGAGSRPS